MMQLDQTCEVIAHNESPLRGLVWGIDAAGESFLLILAHCDYMAKLGLSRRKNCKPLTGHQDVVFAISCSPDGQTIFITSKVANL